MNLSNQSQIDIEKLWETLSPSDQKEILQKFIETTKKHFSPPRIQKAVTKHELQSPETPHNGGTRKVYIILNFF